MAQSYQPGDLVIVTRNISKVGLTKKLLPKYIGPYQIVGRKSPVTYLVEDILAKRKRAVWRRFTAHVSQIKRFRVPTDIEWDRDEQRRLVLEVTEEPISPVPRLLPPMIPVKRTKSGRVVIPPKR